MAKYYIVRENGCKNAWVTRFPETPSDGVEYLAEIELPYSRNGQGYVNSIPLNVLSALAELGNEIHVAQEAQK